MTADLERDLSLATAAHSPRTGVVSAREQGGTAPSGNGAGRRLSVPTKRKAPSLGHSRVVTEVASTAGETEQATVSDAMPVAAPTPVEAPAPPPTTTASGPSDPGIIVGSGTTTNTGTDGSGNSGAGRGHDGAGVSGAVVGIIGAIIRGSAAGVDNCDPPRAGRRGTLDRGGIMGAILGGVVRGQGGTFPRGRGY
jgi:hypothetical protein